MAGHKRPFVAADFSRDLELSVNGCVKIVSTCSSCVKSTIIHKQECACLLFVQVHTFVGFHVEVLGSNQD